MLNDDTKLCVGVLHDKKKDKKYNINLDSRIKYYYSQEMDDIWIQYPWE